jgi:hypothetical protein
VSFGVGGIGEYLQHNVNGWLVDEATPQVSTHYYYCKVTLCMMHTATSAYLCCMRQWRYFSCTTELYS